MAIDQKTIDKIVDAFRGEIGYIQSAGYFYSFETRRLRWLSICSIVYELENNLDLPPDTLYNLIRLDSDKLNSFKDK